MNFRSLAIITAMSSVVLWGCNDEAPPPPPSGSATTTTLAGNGGFTDPSQTSDVQTASDSASGTYELGGAEIGSSEMQSAVDDCHEKYRFFDRLADGKGECTPYRLAQVDCTIRGIRDLFGESSRANFDAEIDAKFSKYSIDQCVDCPDEANYDACSDSSGARLVGTKVTFGKDEGNSISMNYMLIGKRPNQKSKKVAGFHPGDPDNPGDDFGVDPDSAE